MAGKKQVSPAVAVVVIVVVVVILVVIWFSMGKTKKATTGSMAPPMAQGGAMNPAEMKAKLQGGGAGGGGGNIPSPPGKMGGG